MKINGNETVLESEVKLDVLLEQQGFDVKKIAVMKNGEIVPKARYADETVNDKDSLEVVSFVGGG